jgi:hypothetical protein
MMRKILSLDGGGSWALLQAMALQTIYDDTPGWDILAHFDLAVGNSGGSIVLGGLVENMRPSQILNLFSNQTNRQSIFKALPLVENLLSHVPIFPKYSAAGKLAGLTNLFGAQGATPLANLPALPGWPNGPGREAVKIMIPAFDYDSARAVFFRSYTTPFATAPSQTSLVNAVHASSDAPVIFFDAPAAFDAHNYWDGAMGGFNNPVMAGVTELLATGVAASEIVALTIGTGTVKLLPAAMAGNTDPNLVQAPSDPSLLNDLSKAGGCITDDPPDQASYTAHVVLTAARDGNVSELGPVVRLNPVVGPVQTAGTWGLPAGLGLDDFNALKNLGMDAVTQPDVDRIITLGTAWIAGTVPNQPLHTNPDTLASLPPAENFPAGVARWQHMTGGA